MDVTKKIMTDTDVRKKSKTKRTPKSCEKPECAQCGMKFSCKSGLNRHMKLHNKSHKCTDCGKSFCKESQLKIHIRGHTGELSFRCDVCGKYFAEKHALTRHAFIHTDQKACNCEICGKGFTHVAYLQNHLKIHTGEEHSVCKECGKHFRLESYLISHMKRKHNYVGWCPTTQTSNRASEVNTDSGETENETFEIGSYQNGKYQVSHIQISKSVIDSQLLGDPPKPFCVKDTTKDTKKEASANTLSGHLGSMSSVDNKDATYVAVSRTIYEKDCTVKFEKQPDISTGPTTVSASSKVPQTEVKHTQVPVFVVTMESHNINTNSTFLNIASSPIKSSILNANSDLVSKSCGSSSSKLQATTKYVKIAPKPLSKDVSAVSCLKNASFKHDGQANPNSCESVSVASAGTQGVKKSPSSQKETQVSRASRAPSDKSTRVKSAASKRTRKPRVGTGVTERSPAGGRKKTRTRDYNYDDSWCNKEFYLDDHLKQAITEDGHVCLFCEKRFSLRKALQDHIKMHLEGNKLS